MGGRWRLLLGEGVGLEGGDVGSGRCRELALLMKPLLLLALAQERAAT